MFWPLGAKKRQPRRRAIRAGLLIDMQRPPFSNFNSVVWVTWPMAMTKAAYQEFIAVSRSALHPEFSEEFRWSAIMFMLIDTQSDSEEYEAILELNVLEADGFFVPKKIKVASGVDDEGNTGFNFMLPDETWPVEAPLVEAS